MSKLAAILFSVLTLLNGNVFAEVPLLTAVGNLNSSTSCKLGSQVSGRVEQVFVEVGDFVKKGQPLLQLDKKLFEIDVSHKEAVLESAKIEFHDAEVNYLRMKKLWEKPAGQTPSISQKRYEDAKLRYEQAQVQVMQDEQDLKRAQLSLAETTIVASFDGVVSNRFVDPGEAITNIPITHVVEIQAADPLFLEFSIPQGYLKTIQIGTPITFKVEGHETKKFEAKVNLIYPSIDQMTRTFKCRATVDNPNLELHPGSLAKVEICKHDSI